MTTDLTKGMLSRPENDLVEIARSFKVSSDACWHIDRHVYDVSEAEHSELRVSAIASALALARTWLEKCKELRGPGLLLSSPIVTIDDEWLAGVPEAPPPHVYICLARDETSFCPVHHEEAVPRASSGNPSLDSEVTKRGQILRIEGAFEGEPGAWIVEFAE